MARINIEECWWSDPRREYLGKLLGNILLADAVAIRAWKLAQDFWSKDQSLIPLSIFQTIEANDKLIQANLVLVENGFVYVCGTKDYCDWLFKRKAASRKGGVKSAEKRNKNSEEIQANVKQTSSKRKQTQPSYSYSYSNSINNTEDININNLSNINYSCSEPASLVPEPKKQKVLVPFFISESLKPMIDQNLINAWKEMYPEEFIFNEMQKARVWILSNLHKAPKKDYGRFLSGWLQRGWERERKALKTNHVDLNGNELMKALEKF